MSTPSNEQRQVAKATAFFRLSQKQGKTELIPLDDAQRFIQDKEVFVPDVDNASNLRLSVAKRMFDPASLLEETDDDEALDRVSNLAATSWRVSPDEFIVKIDASPLHMSAARRMFDKQQPPPPQQKEKSIEEEDIDDVDAPDDEQEQEQHETEWKQFWKKLTSTLAGSGSTTKK
jgi:hypothetical protein